MYFPAEPWHDLLYWQKYIYFSVVFDTQYSFLLIIFTHMVSFSAMFLHTPLWHAGVSQHQQFSYIQSNIALVLMHSNIVNGISYCAMLILCWNNVGELGLYLRYSLSCISPFSFCMFVCHSDSVISYLGFLHSLYS